MSSYTRGAPTVFFLCAVCALAQKDWDATGGDVLFLGGRYSGHPMLYFGREAVLELQGAALTTHAQLALQIRNAAEDMLASPAQFLPPRDPVEFSARWNEIYGNNLSVLALFCLLYPQRAGAITMARQYMERMAAQPSWLVKDAPWDEVPMAHSLVGFATAYDFLYEFLSEEQRDRYLHVIGNASLYMYEKSFQRGWGFQYLHNHQPTNCVALLTASLILMNQGCLQEAYLYIQQVMSIMEKALVMLRSVTDGSLYEGVAYGTYSTRSLFQYILLLQRHFNISHFSHPWLLKHFQFLYRTVLPGFQRSVAIGDSNYNWFYGPESQLVFLDRFVMRNGHANFLAEQIRKNRVQDGPGQPAKGQKWSTLHTEFIWYDAGLHPTPPPDFGTPSLHYFEDWGVVTWGGGLPSGRNHSFLSFKSGKLGGRAIFDIVHRRGYSEWIQGWKNFNAGHEHPDQNSFTFAPGGFPFITEGLYGPKYTLLNNVVMFGPVPSGACFVPWEGQMTESCDSKWSKYKYGPSADSQGRVEAALVRDGVVFMRGEARGAYSPALKIQSLQRNLVLLQPDLLVLLDHVHLDVESPAHTMSAFFHNTDFPFRRTELNGIHGAVIRNGRDPYTVLWRDDTGYSTPAGTSYFPYPHGYPYNGTNYANVTVPLRFPNTRVTYVFFGPDIEVREFNLSPGSDPDSVAVRIVTRDHAFSVTVLTSEDLMFATVRLDDKEIMFDRAAAAVEVERPLVEVANYASVVNQNLRRLKPVFQALERHVTARVLNPDGLRKVSDAINSRKKKKNVKAVVETMFALKNKNIKKKKMEKKASDALNERLSQIEEQVRKRKGTNNRDRDEIGSVKGRVFKEVHEEGMAEAPPVGVSYIRLFLLVNMGAFVLLLAVLVTQLQRRPSLQTQRCIYCVLLLDSFVLLSLYSSCSHGYC